VSNPGLIWLDDESAKRLIDDKERAGEISAEEGENLRKFAVDGYFVTKVEVSAEDAAEIDRDVDRLWREKPSNLTFAYDSPPLRFSTADEQAQRKPRYRIHELHCVSPVALRLTLEPRLHRYASLILGEPAIATQSLYFEFGSQQMLHRDSTVVPDTGVRTARRGVDRARGHHAGVGAAHLCAGIAEVPVLRAAR
jgi:hypothetical protein